MIMLPKMTNNHIHLWALIPFEKLFNKIKLIDPELYNSIYVYSPKIYIKHENPDLETVPNTLVVSDNNVEGQIKRELTNKSDWKKLSEIDFPNYVISNSLTNPFDQLDIIQKQVRLVIRNVKVYYYLWYYALQKNYQNNIFYLNVRGKPGSISKSVKIDDISFLTSKYIYSQKEFLLRIKRICDNITLTDTDLSFFYKTYGRIKMESDIIINTVNLFNSSHQDMSKIDIDFLINKFPMFNLPDNYKPHSKPNMLIQFIVTFAKHQLNQEIDKPKFYSQMRSVVYSCVLINEQYGYNFFNGYDMVGNEQQTYNFMEYKDILDEFKSLKKYGMEFYPHVGESKEIPTEITPDFQYIIDNDVNRIAHAMSFLSTKKVLEFYKSKQIHIESCPNSNYILGYYNPKSHPHKKFVDNKNIKIMIGSDDNAPFNYSTVTDDYLTIKDSWNLSDEQLHKLIKNGMECIPEKSKKYYNDVYGHIIANLNKQV